MSDGSAEYEPPNTAENSPREKRLKDLTDFYLKLGRKYGIPEDVLNGYTQEAVNEAMRKIKLTSQYDSKYDILNSEGLNHELEIAIALSKRYNLPLSAAFVDLKGLKAINEHPKLGQEAGDRALKIVVRSINSCLRRSDFAGKIPTPEEVIKNGGYISEVAAREGGDEFVILFLGTPLNGGVIATHRVLEKISENSDREMPKHREIFNQPLTARAGIAQFDPNLDKDGTGFLRRIGGAMYMTKKREGRLGVSSQIYEDKDYHTVIIKELNAPRTQGRRN